MSESTTTYGNGGTVSCVSNEVDYTNGAKSNLAFAAVVSVGLVAASLMM